MFSFVFLLPEFYRILQLRVSGGIFPTPTWPDFLLGKELLIWARPKSVTEQAIASACIRPSKTQNPAKEKKKGGGERTDCPSASEGDGPFRT